MALHRTLIGSETQVSASIDAVHSALMGTPLRTKLTETQTALELLRTEHEELLHGQEQVISAYTMMERRVEELSFIDLNNILGANEEVLPQAKRVETIMRIRRLRVENPMAKNAVKLILRFVLGKGISHEVTDTNVKRIMAAFWNDPINQAVFTSHFALTTKFDEMLTDGEQFVALFSTPSESPYVRIGKIPMEEITNILYDPDNDEMPVWYRRMFKKRMWDPKASNGQGDWAMDTNNAPTVRYYRDWRVSDAYLANIESRGLVIPEGMQAEGRIKHRMVNPLKMRTGFRGVSELFASREWFRVFKEFMEDRGAINAMANALAYQRKVTGGPTAVANMSGTLGGLQTGMGDQPLTPSSFRRPMAGSIINTNNAEYKSIRADTGAPAAARDAEMIRATAVSGMGMPDYYFGASNTALAGAQSAEISVVKAFEEFQTFLRNDLYEISRFVIATAMNKPVDDIIEEAKLIAWVFPPIATQDIVKWVTGFAQWTQQVAPGNRVVRERSIRAVGSVLGIPDLEILWDDIVTDEARIAKEQDAAKAQQQASADARAKALADGTLNPNQPDNNLNGGQKAGPGPKEQGASPEITRLSKGRPPAEGATGPRSKRQ